MLSADASLQGLKQENIIESEGASQEGLLEGTYQQGPDEEDLTDEEGLQ